MKASTILMVLFPLVAAFAQDQPAPPRADAVFIHGNIYTGASSSIEQRLGACDVCFQVTKVVVSGVGHLSRCFSGDVASATHCGFSCSYEVVVRVMNAMTLMTSHAARQFEQRECLFVWTLFEELAL